MLEEETLKHDQACSNMMVRSRRGRRHLRRKGHALGSFLRCRGLGQASSQEGGMSSPLTCMPHLKVPRQPRWTLDTSGGAIPTQESRAHSGFELCPSPSHLLTPLEGRHPVDHRTRQGWRQPFPFPSSSCDSYYL